jgi:sugar phosphate isomerase/epimerase
MAELVPLVGQLGLSHIQLALGPLIFLDDKRKHFELGILRDSGLILTAGMIAFPGEDYSSIARIRLTAGFLPDESWKLRKQITLQAANLAGELGLKILTCHAGFIPQSNQTDYPKLLGRVKELAQVFRDKGLILALETGQESAPELLQFLNDLPGGNIAVNYDPANMLLYGSGDPIEAIHTLSRHIRHVHLKDAVVSSLPAVEWGRDVTLGTGEVDFEELFLTFSEINYTGPVTIESEAGAQSVEEIRAAIAYLQKLT